MMEEQGGEQAAASQVEQDQEIVAETVNIEQSGASSVKADTVYVAQGGILSAEADVIEVDQGGIFWAAGQTVIVSQGGAGVVVAEQAELQDSSVILLAARQVSGEARILLDLKAGIAFGLAAGLAAGLVRALLGRR
jgi:hypothetical protein